MRLAHISDLHILDLHGVTAKRFVSRRVFGGANLLLRRAGAHKIETVERLIEDLLREEPDHILVSGDLSNLALDSEFERAFHLLKLLGDRSRLYVVPGNHDYYTAGAIKARRFEKYFHPYMFERFSDLDPWPYPFVKDLGPIAIVGVNSACQTVPPFAYGMISERQYTNLEAALTAIPAGKLKGVLMHHALHRMPGRKEYTDRLIGRDRFLNTLFKHKVDVVFYGHDHAGRISELRRDGHSLRLICCGSSTRSGDTEDACGRYRIIHLEDGAIRAIDTKVYDPSDRAFHRVF